MGVEKYIVFRGTRFWSVNNQLSFICPEPMVVEKDSSMGIEHIVRPIQSLSSEKKGYPPSIAIKDRWNVNSKFTLEYDTYMNSGILKKRYLRIRTMYRRYKYGV